MLRLEQSDFSHLADLHALGDQPIPEIVHEVASGRPKELVWRNDLGGLTYRIDDTFLKWNPQSTGIDLDRERVRLNWISTRHPAPRVIRFGVDGSAQWLLTAGLGGDSAVGDQWRARRPEAIAAIAIGLRAIHALPTEDTR